MVYRPPRDPLDDLPFLTRDEILVSIDRLIDSRSMSRADALSSLLTLSAAVDERINALKDEAS